MHSNTDIYYDIIYKDWIGPNQTESEIELIKSLIPSGSMILDIGSGTGRHLIPLSKLGYKVIGIEPSPGKVKILKSKFSQLKSYKALQKNKLIDLKQNRFPIKSGMTVRGVSSVIHAFLDQANLDSDSFELAICMWNSIFEIAKTQTALDDFYKEVYRLLKPGGSLIISTGDSDNFVPQDSDFEFEVSDEDKIFKVSYKLLNYEKNSNITHSLETIKVMDKEFNLIDECQKEIIQRHWLQNELLDIGESVGFEAKVIGLKNSDEKYFMFRKVA